MRLNEWLKQHQGRKITRLVMFHGESGYNCRVDGSLKDEPKTILIDDIKLEKGRGDERDVFFISWSGGSASYPLGNNRAYPSIPKKQSFFIFDYTKTSASSNGIQVSFGFRDNGRSRNKYYHYSDMWILCEPNDR